MNANFNAHISEHAREQRRRRVQQLMLLSEKKQQRWLRNVDASQDQCLAYNLENTTADNCKINISSKENEILCSMMSLLKESMEKQDTIVERIRERVEEKYKAQSLSPMPDGIAAAVEQAYKKENPFSVFFSSIVLTAILLIIRALLLNVGLAFCQ